MYVLMFGCYTHNRNQSNAIRFPFYINNVLTNMEQIGSVFDEYVIILCYDNSGDDTLKILMDYLI